MPIHSCLPKWFVLIHDLNCHCEHSKIWDIIDFILRDDAKHALQIKYIKTLIIFNMLIKTCFFNNDIIILFTKFYNMNFLFFNEVKIFIFFKKIDKVSSNTCALLNCTSFEFNVFLHFFASASLKTSFESEFSGFNIARQDNVCSLALWEHFGMV